MKRILWLTVLVLMGGTTLTVALARQARPLPPLRWSDPKTWPSGRLPVAGDEVSLLVGRTVLLDVNPPALKEINVGAGTTLQFEDSANRRLIADQILVSGAGAKLVVGTETRPFQHHATIQLTGTSAMLSVSGKGARLQLFGQAGRTSWTHLAETAKAGDDTITLATPRHHWRTGDTLVIAPTGFDAREAEVRTIRAVDKATVRLNKPLRFTHWGQKTKRGIDERAEVGLLSRNIVVEGEEGRGGCVMMMGTGAGAQIASTEFRHLGKRGKKGNYPVHFHLVGNGTGSFVRDSSLHHCYNRWLTIHGTRHVVAQNNVGFDTIGHGYFLEDGDETDNTLEGNLGIRVRQPDAGKAVTSGDVRPAVFWISNPNNTLRGNVAAGSDYYGFWYDLPKRPTGVAALGKTTKYLLPRRTKLGEFRGNTAHTCEHDGLFVDNAANPPGVTGAPTYDPPEPAFFYDFTAYKCRRRGVWMRGSRLFLRGATLADNGIGVTLAVSSSGMSDSLIVGETENRTGLYKPDEPSSPLCGFEFYDGPLQVENTTFADFTPRRGRPTSALGVLRFSPFFLDPLNVVRGLHFENANRFHWERRTTTGNPDLSGDGYRTAIFVDGDGSVTGQKGARVVAGEPMLYKGTDACKLHPDWNAAVCEEDKTGFARLFIDNRDETPEEIGPVKLASQKRPRHAVRMWGIPREGANNSFQSNVRTGEAYVVTYEGKAPPKQLRLTLRNAVRAGESVTVTVPAGPPDEPVAIYSIDAHKQKTLLSLDGKILRRDARTGTVTVSLLTAAPDAKTALEIVRGKEER